MARCGAHTMHNSFFSGYKMASVVLKLKTPGMGTGSNKGCFGLCAMSARIIFRRKAEAFGCLSSEGEEE